MVPIAGIVVGIAEGFANRTLVADREVVTVLAVDRTCLVVAIAGCTVAEADRCYLVDSSYSIPPSMPTI